LTGNNDRWAYEGGRICFYWGHMTRTLSNPAAADADDDDDITTYSYVQHL